jgi:Fe-S cluster assembly protein SufD
VKTKPFIKQFKKTYNTKNVVCQLSKEKENERKDWLESVLSVRNQPEKKYLDKWRKVGVNLIKGLPFPSKSDESWKLTSLDSIFEMRFSNNENNFDSESIQNSLEGYDGARIVFVNGVYSEKFSDFSSLPNEVFIGDIKDYQDEGMDNPLESLSKGESGINGGFFPTLNIACLSELYILSIPPNLELEDPINIIYIGSDDQSISSYNHRFILISGENSKSKIIEHHIGMENCVYLDNNAISIITKEKSMLDFFLINESSNKSVFISSIHAEIKENSSLNFSTISLGGVFSRVNLGVDINGTNCVCNIKGASVANDKQISDFHSRISHNLPNSKSSQLQKILLTDKAHGVFAGKIQVQHGAGNTSSDQLCKTLLLSPSSRIDALPILEINNENVKCTHGSTVSDLDTNQLFYLQSRGIPQGEAKNLLTIGFINEMVNEYPEMLRSKILKKLNFLM